MRYQILETPCIMTSQHVEGEGASATRAAELAEAAAGLYDKLHHGQYTVPGGAKRSLGGDTTKWRFAEGLTKTEGELLRSVQHISSRLPGTQEVRQLMGHALLLLVTSMETGSSSRSLPVIVTQV